jgi:hypothetical protein
MDDGCLANDDLFTAGELYVDGSIGWAQQAPEPFTEPLEALVPCGSPAPSPSPTETQPPGGGGNQHGRDVSLFATRGSSRSRLRLYGKVTSDAASCVASQQVRLQMKMHKRYRTVARTTTDTRGKYSYERRSGGVRTYRAVAPASPACEKARSRTVRAG